MTRHISSKIDQQKFKLVYLLSLLFMQVTYLSILPIFEGFDETAHFSSLRQIADTGTIPFFGKSYLDQFVTNYEGPIPYGSSTPPFDTGLTYQNFFKQPILIERYAKIYRQRLQIPVFQPSNKLNWQAQHPPLYYFLLVPFLFIAENFSFTAQIFFLRLLSCLFALLGVAFGLLAINQLPSVNEKNLARLGFWIYPIVLPMFFPEFVRMGNDSLCLLLVGFTTYLFSLWLQDEYNWRKSTAIGITLGMGLLTKAFFLPINFGLIIFLLIRIWVNKRESSKQFWSLLQIIIPAALIGGGWYLYNFLTIGEFTGSAEAVSLANQSGFISGLKEHFSIYGLTQGGITIFVSYVWAGTWSLVRLPTFLQLPLLILFACILISYGWQLKRCYLNDPKWVMVSILIFFIASLFWHVLVGLAINGRGATPGWYLHILMPWIAPAVGGGITYFLRYKTTRRLTVLLCVYAILYHMAALWSYFALFTGCAGKGDNTNFVFTGKFFCFDQIPLLIQRSSVFGYPLLAAFGLLGWLFANLWLFKQIRNSDITFDFNSTP